MGLEQAGALSNFSAFSDTTEIGLVQKGMQLPKAAS